MNEHRMWEQLPSAYPQLFSSHEPPSFECGAGWVGIVSTLCQRLMSIRDENPGVEITIDRVKQKFGLLRVHFRARGASATLRGELLDTVQIASDASARCCEICSAIGQSCLGQVNKVRCDACIDL